MRGRRRCCGCRKGRNATRRPGRGCDHSRVDDASGDHSPDASRGAPRGLVFVALTIVAWRCRAAAAASLGLFFVTTMILSLVGVGPQQLVFTIRVRGLRCRAPPRAMVAERWRLVSAGLVRSEGRWAWRRYRGGFGGLAALVVRRRRARSRGSRSHFHSALVLVAPGSGRTAVGADQRSHGRGRVPRRGPPGARHRAWSRHPGGRIAGHRLRHAPLSCRLSSRHGWSRTGLRARPSAWRVAPKD